MGLDIPRWKWRNREALIQEIDVRGRLRDIRLHYDLQEAIDIKWWEPVLKMVLVVAGIGFAVTFVYLLQRAVDLYGALAAQTPQAGPRPETLRVAFWFVAGSFGLMLVAGLVSLEMLMARLAAIRRMQQIHTKVLERLEAEVEALHEAAGASPPAAPGDSTPA